MIRHLFALIRKEFGQIRRDKKMVAVILVAPVLELIFLSYAANMDVKVVSTAIWDIDKSPTSKEYIRNLVASGYFYYFYRVESYKEISDLIDDGKIILVIVIPANFEKKLKRNLRPKIQVILDGSNGNKASIVFGYLNKSLSGFSQDIMLKRMQLGGVKELKFPMISAEIRVLYNPEIITRVYLLPGILALILLIITVPLTSMSIVREREIGTLKLVIVVPLKKN